MNSRSSFLEVSERVSESMLDAWCFFFPLEMKYDQLKFAGFLLKTGCSEMDRWFLILYSNVTTIKFTYCILLYEGKNVFLRHLYRLFSTFPCININWIQRIAIKTFYISMCIFAFGDKIVHRSVIHGTKRNPALLGWTHSHIYLPQD